MARTAPRSWKAIALLVALIAWMIGSVTLLLTIYAFTIAVWGGGLPCMGGGCDPGGSDPTGFGGLVATGALGLVTVGCFWSGSCAYRRRRSSTEGRHA